MSATLRSTHEEVANLVSDPVGIEVTARERDVLVAGAMTVGRLLFEIHAYPSSVHDILGGRSSTHSSSLTEVSC